MLANIAASVAQIGGAVAGSMIGGGAVNAANNMQARGFDAANNQARNALGAQVGVISPFTQRGNAAGDAINALLGVGGASYATPESQAASAEQENAWAQNALAQIRGTVKKGESRRVRQALERSAGLSPMEQLNNVRAVLGSRGVGILQSLEASRPLPGTQQAGAAPSAPANPQAQQDAFQRFRDSTGYQFNMNEGLNAVAQRFAGSGAYQSGAAMRALQRTGAGIADNTFGNYLNALTNQQQAGLGAAGMQSNAYGNFADRFGGNVTQQAQNSANAAVAQGAIRQNALGDIARSVGGMFGSSYGGGLSDLRMGGYGTNSSLPLSSALQQQGPSVAGMGSIGSIQPNFSGFQMPKWG